MGREPISSNEIDEKTANALVMSEQGHYAEAEQLLLERIRKIVSRTSPLPIRSPQRCVFVRLFSNGNT
jgi:hypothetical protein